MLIHYRKTFSSYVFFAASLVDLNSSVEGVRVIGTDGEKPLSNVFLHEFKFAQHLTCFIHVRRNIKDKLNECNIPHEQASTILSNIFGRKLDSVYQEGLVDCFEDDYEEKLEKAIASWRNLQSSSDVNIEKFITWFMANKAITIQTTMLRTIRENCGLGSPPCIFTTNASESINALLKSKVEYKKHQLPEFIDKVLELVDEQKQEAERALVNRGKCQLRSQYKHLEVQESSWFSMNAQQRKKHFSKFHTIAVSDVKGKDASSIGSPSRDALSVGADVIAETLQLPITCVEGICIKAKELLNAENAIVPAPGQCSEARMVLSYSKKTPHMVTPTKDGGFSCDSDWKSLGICSHSVAVAELNQGFKKFLSCLKRKQRVPNVTHL